MDATRKVRKFRCACTGGRAIDPRDPPITGRNYPLLEAWLAGRAAAAEYFGTRKGLRELIGIDHPEDEYLAGELANQLRLCRAKIHRRRQVEEARAVAAMDQEGQARHRRCEEAKGGQH